jgi:hypothetical protein
LWEYKFAVLPGMTKLLEQAIARARELSDEEQDAFGATILALTEDAGVRFAP